jgi:hypothetical protein
MESNFMMPIGGKSILMNILKRLFCKHEFEWQHNIYGDEINYCGGKRSIWKCKKCGKTQYRDKLV